MEQRKIRFVDRLQDRGFVDQWAFVIFATVGFAAILSAKWFGLDTWSIATGAVFIMFLYAIVVGWTGTGRVRADQAGDNCYYLGLIYTLASLSYAIAKFDPNDTGATIVQGFGVALATTIFGLIMRVFFSQGRPDLENVEEIARLELTSAATRLKTELRDVTRQMKDFSIGLQQSLLETHKAATDSMESFTKASVEGLSSVVEAANSAIRSEANDFAVRAKKYDSSFTKLLNNLESHSESLEGLTQLHNQLLEAATMTQGAVAAANSSIDKLVAGTAEANAELSNFRESGAMTRQSVESMSEGVDEIVKALKLITAETQQQLEMLRKGPGEIIEAALNALKESTSILSVEFEKISSAHRELAIGISGQTKATLEAAQEHNLALETELKASREALLRVHTNLVDVTDKLAKHVGGDA